MLFAENLSVLFFVVALIYLKDPIS